MNSTFFRTLLDWQLAIAPHKSTLFSIRAYVPFPPRQDECRVRQGAKDCDSNTLTKAISDLRAVVGVLPLMVADTTTGVFAACKDKTLLWPRLPAHHLWRRPEEGLISGCHAQTACQKGSVRLSICK